MWDPRELPHYGPWKVSGPVLPLELSRVSSDCRLTLVIDAITGEHCPTRYVLSPRTDLVDAIEDLRCREGTVRKHIGYFDKRSNLSSLVEFPRQVDIINIVRQWCTDQPFDAVVWTALPSNFSEETGAKYSPDAAIDYLRALAKTSQKNALKYIRNAPEEIDTPVRQRVTQEWPS